MTTRMRPGRPPFTFGSPMTTSCAGRVQLVLVGGLPGTGKSTLANGLGDAGVGLVISSDETRKELVGLTPTTAAVADVDQGLYRPESVDRTYDEMLTRARRLLSLGETVILDASFTSARHRAAARTLAADADADIVELRCLTSGGGTATARGAPARQFLVGRDAGDRPRAGDQTRRVARGDRPSDRRAGRRGPR